MNASDAIAHALQGDRADLTADQAYTAAFVAINEAINLLRAGDDKSGVNTMDIRQDLMKTLQATSDLLTDLA